MQEGYPYIAENITHNSHQEYPYCKSKETIKNIRRINETFSMLYDIDYLKACGLNCMVKQAGKHTKIFFFFPKHKKQKRNIPLTIVKGKGMTNISGCFEL